MMATGIETPIPRSKLPKLSIVVLAMDIVKSAAYAFILKRAKSMVLIRGRRIIRNTNWTASPRAHR